MKLKHIDSIRGIAILMVILGHIGQEIKGLSFFPNLFTSYGQMGVQLFFVASSYTLCLSATNRIGESNPIKKYAIRRFFRIAPVYYLGLLGYFLFELLLYWNKTGLITIPNKYTFLNVLTNVFFVHGFYPPANNTIVPGGWSIGTEMAFYVVFPFLFFYCNKKASFSLKTGIVQLFLVVLFSQLLLFLICLFTGYSVENNGFVYYNLINQFPVFCVGILFYFLEQNAVFKKNWKFDALAFVTLTAVNLILWKSDLKNVFSIIPIIAALSFVFLISVFRKNDKLNFNFLVKIGTVSYSMYIIHFVLLNFSGSLSTKLSGIVNKNILLVALFSITVFVTFLLAMLSEKFIEKPFIELGRKLINKLKQTES